MSSTTRCRPRLLPPPSAQAGGPEVRDVSAFDEYRGEQIGADKRSVAFRVAFGSHERTLTDEDAAVLRTRIVEALRERFGAELRA